MGGSGVLTQLVSLMTGAVHAAAAVMSVVISVPAILLEGVITLVVSVAKSGGDHNTGTAGMCTGWSSEDCCSSTFPAVSQGDTFGTQGFVSIAEIDLLELVTEHSTALPFLSFDLLAVLLAYSLWVSSGGSSIIPFGICVLEWVMCDALIL